MARITIEDCLNKEQNRFQLIHKAAIRARQLQQGAEPKVPAGRDKNTVIALREIAANLLDEKTEDNHADLFGLTDTSDE